MSATVEEFVDVLQAAERSLLDLDKLRLSSRYGIPPQIRGHVWKYLLCGRFSHENSRNLYEEFVRSYALSSGTTGSNVAIANMMALSSPPDTVLRKLRGELGRYFRARTKHFHNPAAGSLDRAKERTERVLTIFLARNSYAVDAALLRGGELHNFSQGFPVPLPSIVNMFGPFLFCMGQIEHDTYFAFECWIGHVNDYFQTHSITTLLGQFTRLMRTYLPDLVAHLEEEEVGFSDWAFPWLTDFLSKQLPFECVLRLWDTYFSAEEGLELHVYVCIAILHQCQGHLEELEQADIISNLCKLPILDMERVIGQAYRLMQECSVAESMGLDVSSSF